MKLKMKNVGGITETTSIELKEGLNVIRAPNATGKTSFTHAIKLVSMDNQQLRNHPEFINDFTDKAIVEVDGKERVIEKKGLSPMSKTDSFFRLNGRQNIIFAMPENEFLNTVRMGEPIDKFLESFSDAQYFKELIEKDGVLREVRDELDDKYGVLNTEAKEAHSLIKNIKKEKDDLEKIRKVKVKVQTDLEDMKHKIKINKEEEGRLGQLTDDIEDLESEIEGTKGSMKSWHKDIKIIEDDIQSRNIEMEAFKKEFPNQDNILQKMEDNIKKLETELQDEDGIYKVVENLESEITSTENNIEGNECLACGRPFTKKQQDQRLKELNKKKDELDKKIRKTENQLKELNEDKSNFKERRSNEFYNNKQEIDSLESQVRTNTDKIRDAKAVIEQNSKELNKKKEAKELVKGQIDPKIKKLIDDEEALSRQINAIIKNIKEYEGEYETVADSEKQVVVIKTRYEFLKRMESVIKEELANLKNIVKDDFNKKIMPIYNKLGFKDFKNIEIDSTFRIKVNRKGKEQDINRLSTSEQVTLGVIVMLAGKEEYLPDYPFFILDEVTTAYDPVRFKKIIEYLANETKTKYTIVTAFSPTGDKIKVEYKL